MQQHHGRRPTMVSARFGHRCRRGRLMQLRKWRRYHTGRNSGVEVRQDERRMGTRKGFQLLPDVSWDHSHYTSAKRWMLGTGPPDPPLLLSKLPLEVCFTSTHHHISHVNVAYDEVAACHPPMPHVAFRARVANSPVASCHLGT